MEISIYAQSKRLPEFLKQTARFYAQELGILKSKYNVLIVTDPTLKKEGSHGLCAKTGEREITIMLYSHLSPVRLLYVLAHEMVHAKQIARGQYKSEFKRGTTHHYWMGRRVKAEYIKRPWEREAFSKESILVEILNGYVTKELKKKNKKS